MGHLEKELVIKRHGPFGPGQEYTYLKAKRQIANKDIRITPDSIYIDETAAQLQLESAKPAATPSTTLNALSDDKEELTPIEIKTYRSAVGRLLYLSHWRFDISGRFDVCLRS